MTAISKPAVLATAILLATSVLGGCTTYGTGVNPGTQTLSDIEGLVNVSGSKKAGIDYKPRPPLAAPPPGAAPPVPGSATAVASAGDWPNDPDAAAKAAKAASRKRAQDPRTDALYSPGLDIPVQHEKSGAYWHRGGTASEDAASGTKEQEMSTRKAMAAAKNTASFDANGNPIRKTLSDPPVVYREPDPSAPTVFNTKKKFHWPWQKAKPDDASSSALVDDSATVDQSNLQRHASPVQSQ